MEGIELFLPFIFFPTYTIPKFQEPVNLNPSLQLSPPTRKPRVHACLSVFNLHQPKAHKTMKDHHPNWEGHVQCREWYGKAHFTCRRGFSLVTLILIYHIDTNPSSSSIGISTHNESSMFISFIFKLRLSQLLSISNKKKNTVRACSTMDHGLVSC